MQNVNKKQVNYACSPCCKIFTQIYLHYIHRSFPKFKKSPTVHVNKASDVPLGLVDRSLLEPLVFLVRLLREHHQALPARAN